MTLPGTEPETIPQVQDVADVRIEIDSSDRFWNSEIARTLVPKTREVLAPYRSPAVHDILERFKDRAGY